MAFNTERSVYCLSLYFPARTQLDARLPPPIDKPSQPPDELLDALLGVFSERGFDGASLAELARASSRSKASLYHHFPGGKSEMIRHLIDRSAEQLESLAFSPLRNFHSVPGDGKKKRGQKQARAALGEFADGFGTYLSAHDGNCLLATVALTQPELLEQSRHDRLTDWLALLSRACEGAGHKPKAARRLAWSSLAQLYGSLTLNGMGSDVSIRQAGKWLKRDLLAKP